MVSKKSRNLNIKVIRINGISTIVRLPRGMKFEDMPKELHSNFRKERMLITA